MPKFSGPSRRARIQVNKRRVICLAASATKLHRAERVIEVRSTSASKSYPVRGSCSLAVAPDSPTQASASGAASGLGTSTDPGSDPLGGEDGGLVTRRPRLRSHDLDRVTPLERSTDLRLR